MCERNNVDAIDTGVTGDEPLKIPYLGDCASNTASDRSIVASNLADMTATPTKLISGTQTVVE